MRAVWVSSLVVMLALALQAERQPFSRYQPIIDRQMFGELPADFDPEKMPSEVAKSSAKGEAELTKEQEQIKSAIRFSSINITPSGETAVGFADNSDPKAPRHYYLKVGERRDGWELKEADAVKATMTIAKGDVTVSLSLGGDSSKSAEATSKLSHPIAYHLRRNDSGSDTKESVFQGLRSKRSRQFEEFSKKLQAENEARERVREEENAKREEAFAQERENLHNAIQELKESIRRRAKTAQEKSEESGSSTAEE